MVCGAILESGWRRQGLWHTVNCSAHLASISILICPLNAINRPLIPLLLNIYASNFVCFFLKSHSMAACALTSCAAARQCNKCAAARRLCGVIVYFIAVAVVTRSVLTYTWLLCTAIAASLQHIMLHIKFLDTISLLARNS